MLITLDNVNGEDDRMKERTEQYANIVDEENVRHVEARERVAFHLMEEKMRGRSRKKLINNVDE